MNNYTRRHHHHRRMSSSGERPKSHKSDHMKPEKYEGTTCFETFLTQFANCAEYNKWSESEKLAYLRWSLKGSAAQMLWGARDLTYKQLVTRLRSRFGNEHMEEHYRVDLQCRRRKSAESLRELAQDIRRLMMLSYPGDQSPISENLTKEHFIVALEDPELELKIREREPRTLDAALGLAQRFEVFRNAVKQRKQRMSRQVVEDVWTGSSSDVVSEVDQSTNQTKTQQYGQTTSKPYGHGTSTKAFNKKQRKQQYENARATQEVRPDDWKEEMLNKVKNLEQAQQVTDANTKKIAAENLALNKEVDKLRHIQHLRAVPAPPVQQSFNNNQPYQYSKGPVCYKCGVQGHMSRECPQLRTQTSAGVVCANRGSYWDQEGRHEPYDHDYYLRVTLANRTVDCLLDTGSEVCLIPDSMVHSNCIKRTGRTLKAANGTPIPIIGEIKLSLSIGGFSTNITALVSPHVIEPMLGIDFLVKNQVVWDFAKSTVTIHGISHVLRSRVNKLQWCRRVVVQENTIVPARSETVLSAKMQFSGVPDSLVATNWYLEVDDESDRRKKYYDIRVKPQQFDVGDWVLYHYPRRFKSRSQKWQKAYIGPFLIVEMLEPSNCWLQKSQKSQKFVAHIDKLKKYYGDTPNSWLPSNPSE